MVAFADARYDHAEEVRLLSTLINDPALRHVDPAALETCYNSLTGKFRTDFAKAAAVVLGAVTASRGQLVTVKAIKKAARLAVVADQKIRPQEEVALNAIAGALGLADGDV